MTGPRIARAEQHGQERGDLVCVVTGASRGAGRGIAVELGARGATVYVTARTLGAPVGERGSLEDTVEQVRDAGGVAREAA